MPDQTTDEVRAAPTVQELHELTSGDLGRCQVENVGFTIRLFGRTWERDTERHCRRKARHVITITCVGHAVDVQRLCRRHFDLVRHGVMKITCMQCDKQATWVES